MPLSLSRQYSIADRKLAKTPPGVMAIAGAIVMAEGCEPKQALDRAHLAVKNICLAGGDGGLSFEVLP